MAEALSRQVSVTEGTWPWERPVIRPRRWMAVGQRLSRVWFLPLLTTVVLVGGYAWLGSVIGGAPGALVGAAAGLLISGGLHMTMNRAVSGPRGHRPVPGPRRPDVY